MDSTQPTAPFDLPVSRDRTYLPGTFSRHLIPRPTGRENGTGYGYASTEKAESLTTIPHPSPCAISLPTEVAPGTFAPPAGGVVETFCPAESRRAEGTRARGGGVGRGGVAGAKVRGGMMRCRSEAETAPGRDPPAEYVAAKRWNRLNRLDHLDYQAFAFHSLQFQSCNGLAHLGLAIYVFAMNLPHKA